METLGNQIMPKLCPNYYCVFCDYNTSKKSSYDNHNLSAKHKKTLKIHEMESNGNQIMPKLCSKVYSCEICSKEFKNRSGLWKHKNKCKLPENNESNINTNINTNNSSIFTHDKDLIMLLIKENSELKTMMMEQQNMVMKVLEKGTHNTTTTTHTNSHNKAFNLNFFLNETCKDAMNIMDFVESIKLQLSDLESVGEVGYIEGISNIIVKNLKELDVTQRPVHCTDKKRETIYIKDEDKWEKDEEQKKMHKIVRKVADKNIRLLPKFKEKYPDYNKASSKHSDTYNKIIIESMGGAGDNDFEKEEKIIKRVSKEVIIEK
jgi:hypothetical protein